MPNTDKTCEKDSHGVVHVWFPYTKGRVTNVNIATQEVFVCHGRVLINRKMARTECAIGEEQCGFRQGRGPMDQMFAVRQLREKFLANDQ